MIEYFANMKYLKLLLFYILILTLNINYSISFHFKLSKILLKQSYIPKLLDSTGTILYIHTSRIQDIEIVPKSPLIYSSNDIHLKLLRTTLSVNTLFALFPLNCKASDKDDDSIIPLKSDEFYINLDNDNLGLVLREVRRYSYPLLVVGDIRSKELLANKFLRVGAILIQIGEVNVEGKPFKEISKILETTARPCRLKFRDPSRFFELLDSSRTPLLRTITTQYLPANTRDIGAPEQNIIVERLQLPSIELKGRAADTNDVMEIQYVAQILGKEDIVDSSNVRAPPGTSTKSIYYILGQQNGPPGKYPKGWDLTLRGMVVGEKRRITLPYSLCYDRAGDKDMGIPSFATLVYTVKLISLT